MKHYRSRRMRRQEIPDIDITALMNLMVILAPFLLITAVFSRVAILELNLPGKSAGNAPASQELQLEVVVRKDRIEVGDRNAGILSSLPNDESGAYRLAALSTTIKQIKSNFPQKTDVTLLAEPSTEYDALVQVMDRVRMAEIEQNGEFVKVELFPNISIGDAPEKSAGLATATPPKNSVP